MTNYEKYFGSPEKVLETIGNLYGVCVLDSEEPIYCIECPYYPSASNKCKQGQLKWLKGECDE